MNILILIFFFLEIKESKKSSGHNFTLVKKRSRLDVRKCSFSQRTINVWNKLSKHASSVNMFNNRIDKYLVKARRGSGFYEIVCIFANMSCLHIHLVTLFNLSCKNIVVME